MNAAGPHAAFTAVGIRRYGQSLTGQGLQAAAALVQQGQGQLAVARSLPRSALLGLVHGADQVVQGRAFRLPARRSAKLCGVVCNPHTIHGRDYSDFFHSQLPDELLNGKFQPGHIVRAA